MVIQRWLLVVIPRGLLVTHHFGNLGIRKLQWAMSWQPFLLNYGSKLTMYEAFSSLVTLNGVLVQKIRVHGHKLNKFIWLYTVDSNFITCPFSFFLWQNLSIVQQCKKFTSSLSLVWHHWSKEVGVKVELSWLLLLITV